MRVVPFAGAHFIDGDRWLAADLQSLGSETDSKPILGVRVDIPFRESWAVGLEGIPDVTKTEAAIAAGGGVVWQATSRLGVRFDVRDHARFCRDLCDEPPETLHDLELSGGIAIHL